MARTPSSLDPFEEFLAERYAAIRAEGRAEGRAEVVAATLEARFGALAPGLRARVLGERDLAVLDRWLGLAATASLQDFERATDSAR